MCKLIIFLKRNNYNKLSCILASFIILKYIQSQNRTSPKIYSLYKSYFDYKIKVIK